jgi:protocatechuate 3,4-dioxygenase beta subunit
MTHPHDAEEHDLGLQHDLVAISRQAADRRRLLGYMLGGSALVLLPGCGADDTDTSSDGTGTGTSGSGSSGSGSSGTTSCVADPEETNGPYPSDGSNSVNGSVSNVLVQSGIVRSDIRASFGSATGVASGVPLRLTLNVVNSNNSCAPLSGLAVYLWHCTANGLYSLYSSGAQNENYLRGVQETNASGQLTFTTIFPGCYSGRYPHIHFEVYQTLATATRYANRLLCGQMALPRAACTTVYSTATGYGSSTANLGNTTIATDGIFADNTAAQIAQQTIALSGSVAAGYDGTITVGVAW